MVVSDTPGGENAGEKPWTAGGLEEIRAHVHELAANREGAFYRWGIRSGRVDVHLRADQQALARDLLDRYGEAVRVTLGVLRFPGDEGSSVGEVGPAGPPLPPLPPAVDVAPERELRIRSGADARSALVFTNRGSERLTVPTNGQLTGRIVDPRTGRTVGVFPGAQSMPLVVFSIDPGGSGTIPVIIGSACPVRAMGYATPPGLWSLEPGFRSPLLPITVVA